MCRDKKFPTVPNKQIDCEVKSLRVSCTNKGNARGRGCAWRGEIRAVEAHKKTCPLEMVNCEYHNVGCRAKMCRQDLKEHNKLKVQEHLALNTLKLKNLERLVYRLAVNDISGTSEDGEFWCIQLESLAEITALGDQVCPVIVKMAGFAAVKENEEKWFSDPFYTHNKGYKVCLCVDTDGFKDGDIESMDDSESSDGGSNVYLSVFLYLMKGPHDDELTWPLRGELKVKLLNQISDSGHHSETIDFDDDTPNAAVYRVIDDDDRAAEGLGDNEFISHDDFYDTSINMLKMTTFSFTLLLNYQVLNLDLIILIFKFHFVICYSS